MWIITFLNENKRKNNLNGVILGHKLTLKPPLLGG
jgi:hypothetical protein